MKWIAAALMVGACSVAQADTPDSVGLYTTQHFAIYWIKSGPNAPVSQDLDGNGRPDYVDTAAKGLESAYRMLSDSLHYRLPRGQTTTIHSGLSVPSGLYPVEIVDMATANSYWRRSGSYGCIHDSLESPDGHGGTQIWLENDFLDGGKDSILVQIRGVTYHNWVKDPFTALRFATAHELYHAFTYEYDWSWVYAFHEMAAVWFESWFTPECQNHWRYLPLFRDNLTRGAFDNAAQQSYGNFLFLKAMSDLYGPHAIRKLWEDRAVNEAGNDDTKWFTAAWKRVHLDTMLNLVKYYGQNAVRLITNQNSMFDENRALKGKIAPSIPSATLWDFDTTEDLGWGAPIPPYAIGSYLISKSSLPISTWNIAVKAAFPEMGGDLYVLHLPSAVTEEFHATNSEYIVNFNPSDTALEFVDVNGDQADGWSYYGTTRTSGLIPRPFRHNLPAFTRSVDPLGRASSPAGPGRFQIDLTQDGSSARRRFQW